MRRVTIGAGGVILALLATSGWSQAGVGLSAKVGTLGYGGDLTFGLTETINVRAAFNTLSVEIVPNENDEVLEGTKLNIDLQTIGGLLDWHPWANNFRLTGGVMVNDNQVVLTAQPGDQVDIGDGEYTVSDLRGEITFAKVCPYVGIGTGNAADTSSRWHFSFDFGVMFHGTPDVSLTATSANPTLQTLLNADVDRQIQETRDDLSAFKFYPVLSFGLSYTF